MRVAVFTDSDFDAMNGVTTTLRAVLRHAPVDVRPRIYTFGDLEVDEPDYLALQAAAIGRTGGSRVYVPRLGVLARRLVADGIDIIHLTSSGAAGLAARYLARRIGLPLVGTAERALIEADRSPRSRRKKRVRRRYVRWLYGACRRLLVPSAAAVRALTDAGWDTDRLVICRRGVDASQFAPSKRSARLRDAWHVSDRRPAILYVGRLAAEKGAAVIEPLGSVLYRHGVAHRFVLAGEGPLVRTLAERCPDAVFLGKVAQQDLPVVMASADLVLYPDESCSAGSVVLEAQASGVPVAVAGTDNAREQMRPDETGVTVPPGEIEALGARLASLLADGTRRHAMGAAGRRFALTRPWPAVLEPLYALYRDLLAAGAASSRSFPGASTPAEAARGPRW